jgi:uncharacterized protein HemX
MDGGPFRAQQPADRRSRPELARRQPEETQSVMTESTPVRPVATPQQHRTAKKETSSYKRFLLPIVGLIIVLLLGLGGWMLWSNSQNANTAIDTTKYQAVFFTNGQVYFGKLQPFTNEYMKLTDIYYLQTQAATDADSKNPQKTTTDQGDVQLIKLGNEIHGPEDKMVISKDQILFYENLKPDSKVSQSIQKQKGTN